MWITPLVELPDELASAQREGNLVVFVGAGASMGPPSNLPNFALLTEQIVRESSSPQEGRKDYDFWLGELERRGIDVHRRVHALIDDLESQPTPLHHAIAALFETAAGVRVVTTNYDRHLSTVMRQRFGGDVGEFRAPALPLGWDFNGLVYLHGSVTQRPKHLVVTDRDFGRAYLVDAWAARFLEAMFHYNYTVLFVGYSHDDMVMNYLSRGLRGAGHRYAFTKKEQSPRWRQREIHPISYPVQDDDHSALHEAISRWAHLAGMGLLDHQQRMAELLAAEGPIDPPTDSYLSACVSDPQRVGFFCQVSQDLRWLPWLENQPTFQRLFDPYVQLGEGEQKLAFWFGELAMKYPAETISVFQRRGGRMHWMLSSALAQHLFGDNRPPTDVINAWATIVLEENPGSRDQTVSFVMADCRLPDDHDLLLRLFDHFTTPRLDIRPGFGLLDSEDNAFPQVWVDPGLIGQEYWLREAWDNQIKPNLDTCADELAVIATRNLLSAWQRLTLLRGDRWDSLSAKRSAVEEHSQDSYSDEVDLLIDVARDVLEYLLHRGDGSGQALLNQWGRLPGQLFRRLVIHGWTERPDRSSDEKLSWLLSTFPIVEGGSGRHEAFRLITQHLATASGELKQEVLRTALQPPQVDYETDDEHLSYITYNLLYWLAVSDPDFTDAKTEFERLQAEHPTFKTREAPDFDSWSSSGSVARQSPLTVEELLQEANLAARMEFLRTYQGDPEEGFFGPNREGLMSAVSQAAATEFGWSMRLVAELEALHDEESDLWEAIFMGWRQTSGADVDWTALIAVAERRATPERWLRTLASLLHYGTSDDGRIGADAVPAAITFARRLWSIGIAQETDADRWSIHGERVDWLSKATTHWAGDLAGFFVYAISKLWRADPEHWMGMTEDIREQLDAMIEQDGVPGEAARVVLASFALFFIDAHTEWAIERLLPLFDWNNSDRAEKAWDGYLRRGRWHDHALLHLMPYFRASFDHLGAELATRRDQFCSFLAHIAIQSTIHPLDDGWLNEFLAGADEETTVSWARAVERVLNNGKDVATAGQWDRWISDYWQRRNDAVPKALAAAEASAMMPWLFSAGAHFPDAAAAALAWPGGLDPHDHFLHHLAKHQLVTDYPVIVTRLLAKLLKETQAPFYGCNDLAKIVTRVRADADETDVRALCNEALRVDCSGAGAWLTDDEA